MLKSLAHEHTAPGDKLSPAEAMASPERFSSA